MALAPVVSLTVVLYSGVPFASVPIVFAPIRVKAASDSGMGPSVCDNDQSKTCDVVVVELLVRSTFRVRPE